jgi:hypothetical protein
MVNLVHRQHVVSNFYLRGFADDRKQVRRVELPGDRRYNVATNNASVIKDFYTITLPDGTRSDAFERMFSGIEDVASSALRAVVSEGVWPLVGKRREALAAWAALQHLRSEGVRNSQVQMQAQMIRLVVGVSGKEALRELISHAEGRDVDDVELDAEWADLTKPSGPDLIPDPVQHLRMLVDLWAPTIKQMMARIWTLVRFQRRCLITSDHPVSLAVGQNYPKYRGVGLVTAEAFVLPLSRRVGLMMGRIDGQAVPELELSGTTKLARSFVHETIRGARRYLYHHPDDDPLAGLDLPDPSSQEWGDIGEDWIREEGLFGDFRENPSRKKQMKALRSMKSGRSGRGMTIMDLTWPIPNRRTNIRRPQ